MKEECSDSSESAKTNHQDSEIRDILNKTSLENTGRESSLYRWSSFTETSIQFAESDSSGTTTSDDSGSVQVEKSKSQSNDLLASSLSSTARSSTFGAHSEIRTESSGDEHHEGYSQDEFELSEVCI